jgi:CBS domain-containing protein
MLFPVSRLLEGRGKPVCISKNQSIREALALMVEHDYSQLPAIDDSDKLIGLISAEGISRGYFHSAGGVSWLDLPVDHCLGPAVTLTRERDIFEALDFLKDVYAIVIAEDNRPTGILTNYDMAHFFRDLTEDMLVVEDIETSLRQLIQATLGTEAALHTALIAEFGQENESPGTPKKGLEELTFGNLLHFVTNESNWPKLEVALAPRELFWNYMDQVRQHRNQLMHFRGRLDPIQHDLIKIAHYWLERRPRPTPPKIAEVKIEDLRIAERSRAVSGSGRYDPLQEFLNTKRMQGLQSLRLKFRDIDGLLGEELPQSAREHPAWWANYYDNSQAKAWLAAGWLVDNVDQTSGEVSFRQSRAANYPGIFDELLRRLKAERPGIAGAAKASLNNWVSFSPFKPGFLAGWTLPREPVLRVELYIDKGNEKENKARFDALHDQKDAIETAIGTSLDWDRLDDRRACRVSASRPFDVSATLEDREPIFAWGVNMMLNFIDTFLPRISSL